MTDTQDLDPGASQLAVESSPAARAAPDFLPLLRGRAVLVLGLGASGLAMARWCARAGAHVTVADTRVDPPGAATLRDEWPTIECLHAAFDATLFQRQPWALVCRSPGIAPAAMQGLREAAQAVGVPVRGELDLFASALSVLADDAVMAYRPAVIAITGTNGKTTVTSLTGQLLARAGWSVAVAGNIGPNLLDVLHERLEGLALPRAWVLELSSFQLDGVEGFEPSAATVLNLTQDHLDWHGSMAAYGEAKRRVFGARAPMLLNRDDPLVMAWQPDNVNVREGGRYRSRPARPFQTFGADQPQRPGDWGLETVNGMTWLVRHPPEEEASLQRLMPADALRIRGRHNACNALAALALACAVGAPLAPMLHGLREYRGEPHRVEPVAIVGGVEFFDDSKGTNVGATLAALRGLGAERRLVVILGGDGKGQDFSPLVEPVARHGRAVALIGRDAAALQAALRDSGVALQDFGTAPDALPQAVQWAAQQAREGDAVLLSPACASLDMFRDYAHRAEVFRAAVRDWQDAQGAIA